MSVPARGIAFPPLVLEGPAGPVKLAERWRRKALVVAFERHFG